MLFKDKEIITELHLLSNRVTKHVANFRNQIKLISETVNKGATATQELSDTVVKMAEVINELNGKVKDLENEVMYLKLWKDHLPDIPRVPVNPIIDPGINLPINPYKGPCDDPNAPQFTCASLSAIRTEELPGKHVVGYKQINGNMAIPIYAYDEDENDSMSEVK